MGGGKPVLPIGSRDFVSTILAAALVAHQITRDIDVPPSADAVGHGCFGSYLHRVVRSKMSPSGRSSTQSSKEVRRVEF